MTSRFESIPEDFLNHLVTTIPGFGEESSQHQFELARMAWIGMTKSNQHSHVEHAMTFVYSDLDSAFGRSNFSKINSRLDFFYRTAGWSRSQKFTRGYFFSDQVRASIEGYLARSPWESTRRPA